MKLSRVFSNTGWILLGSGFNKVSSIILLVILSRYLGVEGFGKFSFALFYVYLFSCVAEFGLTPILTKYVSQGIGNSREVQAKGIILGLTATALGIILAWLGTYILGYQDELRFLIMAASIGLLISFRDVTFRWILEVPFRANLKMRYPVVLGILSELLGLLAVLLTVYLKGPLKTILIVYVLSNLPGFIWLTVISIKAIRPSLQTHSISTIGIIKEAMPIGMSNILRMIYLMFGSLILFQFKGGVDIGYYALVFRLTTSLRIIPEAMMHSFFPLLSEAHVETPNRVREIFKVTMRYGAFIAFPLTLGTMVLAGPIVTLLGGEEFQPASAALSILIWTTFFAFFNTIFRFTFNAIAMQRQNFKISLVMTGLSILLAFTLIPNYGFIGASYSLTASEAIGFVYGLVISRSIL